MTIGAMITDGGPHPEEKWAFHAVEQIISVSDAATPDRAAAVYGLKARLFDILRASHEDARAVETASLMGDAEGHLSRPSPELHHPGDRLDLAMRDIDAAFAGSPFAGMYDEPGRRDQIAIVVGQSLVDHNHTTRLWHADTTADAAAVAYKQSFMQGA